MSTFVTTFSSVDLRNKGCELFAQAFCVPADAKQKKSPGNRIEYAKEAMKLFNQSRVAASREGSRKNWISASKNYAVTSRKLASMVEFQDMYKNNVETIHYYFKEASVGALECFQKGPECGMSAEWIQQMDENLVLIASAIIKFVQTPNKSWRKRCGEIHPYLKLFEKKPHVQALLYIGLANECFKSAVLSCENDDWNEGLQCVSELFQYLQFAKSFQNKTLATHQSFEKLSSDIEDLSHSSEIYQARFLSAQMKFQGDEMKRSLLEDSEDLNIEFAWDVVDKYKQSIVQSKFGDCNCLESEAIATASLGAFYVQVLSTPELGHQYLMHCIGIVDNITQTTGATFFNKPWYQEAKTLIEEYRQKQFCFDQEKIRQQRAPTLALIKPKLDLIQAAMAKFNGRSYRCHALLTYIYEHHPPKNKETLDEDLDKDDLSSLKKAVKRAAFNYSADKPWNKSEGIEWYYLCEEICKDITYFVTEFKGFSSS